MPRSTKSGFAAKRSSEGDGDFRRLAAGLAKAARAFYGRGWVLGTSGNFSAVSSRDPLRLVISASSVDKGALSAGQFLEINQNAKLLRGRGNPSAEALLHIMLARERGAGAVLHTHSVWSTVLSEKHAREGGVAISGYEMLKGLDGVTTHQHREWLPIIENSQDMNELARRVSAALQRDRRAHGFLLRAHGLYTWGRNLAEARRQAEILEFLLEVLGCSEGAAKPPAGRRRRAKDRG